MEKEKKIAVDSEKIATAIRLGVPIAITSYTLPKEMEAYINAVITEFLKQLHNEDIADYIVYYMNELTTNAKKANTKRVYFTEKGLDINDKTDYDSGMKNFKEDSLHNIDHYLSLQKKAGLYVKLSLQATKTSIILDVVNNAPITKQEFKRIFDKLVRARQFSSLEEAFSQVLDDTEGAGLGLIIMVLMLKKMGLDEKAYEIRVVNGCTVNRVKIPRNLELQEQAKPLTKAIIEYINEIPQFPENIMQIQQEINNPNSTMQEIAKLISSDVGLATDLLKTVNSVSFGLSRPCMDIAEAVKLVGLKGIRNLLYSVGTAQLLGASEAEQKEIWANAYKLAFFSLNVAKITGDKQVVENAYVCGLMHDLGKIILQLMYPELMLRLAEIQSEKNIPPQVMDMLMSGLQQAEIGSAIAEKWNFPEAIINTIKYQNDFESAPKEFESLVKTIAFANFMMNFSKGYIDYYQIPELLLKKFKISSEEQLTSLCKRFEEALELKNS